MNKYDKYNKDQLIKHIEGLEQQLISSKYGLYWDKSIQSEQNVERVKQFIPILKSENSLKNSGANQILVEGDNFHILTAISMIGNGNFVDLIYIDPPYNTGKKDFMYNDRFVDLEDGYRHSKWLSFMHGRLKLAREILKEEGLIFISIDDNEQANLKLLCDGIFGKQNFIANLPTIMNLKGNNDQFGFSGTHEYTIVYSKNTNKCKVGEFNVDEETALEEWELDEKGYFKKGATLKATGEDSAREKRPYCFYPFLIKNGILQTITQQEYSELYNPKTAQFNDAFLQSLVKRYEKAGFEVIVPQINGAYGRWRWGYNTSVKDIDEIIIINGRDGSTLYKKQRPQLGDLPTKKPKTLFFKPEYSSGNGTNQLANIIGENDFNNPKPLQLIKDLVFLGCSKEGVVLDFFAGSGTTGQAVLELNQEDGGNRRFILCTNNENNICTNVTYPRLKTVITGIRPDGTKYSDGIPANLHYFKCDFIPNVGNADQAKYNLVEKVNNLLCIAEDVFNLVDSSSRHYIYQSNDQQKHVFMYIDYFEEKSFEEFKKKIVDSKAKTKIVYMFSTDNVVDELLFKEVKGVEIKPIPSKIYEIYKDIVEDIKRG